MRLSFSQPIVGRWWRLVAFWAAMVIAAWAIALASLDRPSPPERRESKPRHNAADALSTWDGRRYDQIASDGYTQAERKNFMFFPLLPALMRVLGGRDHAAIAGILLSQALCLASVVLMSVMAHGPRRASLFEEPGFWMLINPFGIFFLALYTESLFLFLTLVHFASYERGMRSLSIGTGFLAGLTRPTSIVLPALLGTETLQRLKRGESWRWVAAAAVAPIVGVAVFVFGIVAVKTQHLLGYTHLSRELWHNTPTPPLYPYLTTVVTAVTKVLSGGMPPPDMLLRLLSTPAVIGILIWQRRRLPASWIVYCIASLLLMHSAIPWRSSGRYEAVLFPVFFAVAASEFARSRAAWVAAAVLATFWVFAVYQFGSWSWIA